MDLALRRFQLMAGDPPYYSLNLQMIATSSPSSQKGYDDEETVNYAVTLTNDGNMPFVESVTGAFYVECDLTDDSWTIQSLGVGQSVQFICDHTVGTSDLLAGTVINEVHITGSTAWDSFVAGLDDHGLDNVSATASVSTYHPVPSVVLTETSTPAGGDSYEEGETITVTVTVTGDPKYAIYGGSITSSFDSHTWNLGTLTNGEYVLAANAVNTFTWTHTVTSADVTSRSLNFSVTGSAEAFHEWGGNLELALGSNILNVNTYHNYTEDYLTFKALESGTFTLTIPAPVTSAHMTSVSYSTDNGANWTTTNVDSTEQTITTPTITAGNSVLWKGVGTRMTSETYQNSTFSSTGNFDALGNIMSLLYSDNFANQTSFPTGSTYNFNGLFNNATKLHNANMLILPATTLTDTCYKSMFSGCTSLTTAPSLPATTLATSCYYCMFQGCTSLTVSPQLPATTLQTDCYSQMFGGTNVLPDTTNIDFTSSSVVQSGGLRGLFYGTNVTYNDLLTILPLNSQNKPCLPFMFTSNTTTSSGVYGHMFRNCALLTNPPELPSTDLWQDCYYNMFSGCTALTTAPVLPAKTLKTGCYSSMFDGCRSLSYIKALFTTTPSVSYTYNWVRNVASSGTFVKYRSASWSVTGNHGIPSGWTVQTASS